jgi:hypothetical protein
MNIPSLLTAGDTVAWTDVSTTDTLGNPVTSSSWALVYYLRTNTASEGATVTGVARPDDGWDFTITAAASAGFDAGTWYWQAIATSGSDKLTLGAGTFQVKASLVYSGTPGAFDGRTQAEKDLEAVQAAMRSIVSGGAVQQYSIGSRAITKMRMEDLLALESKLKAEVARERAAEKVAAGLGNPSTMFVRFG